MTDKLNDLYPEPIVLKVEGLDIEIKPITIGQLPKISRLLKGVKFTSEEAQDAKFWLELIDAHGDSIIEMVGVACGQSKDAMSALQFHNFVNVAVQIIKVNADFFTRQVMPGLKALIPGSTPASGSSATDTGMETSQATH